jgi:Helix-turn-helix domain
VPNRERKMEELATRKRDKRTRIPSFPLPKRGFTLEEAAYYCGVPAKTIYEAMRNPDRANDREKVLEARARFPVRGVKRGKSWIFQKSDLDSWLDTVFAEQ